MSHPSFRRLRCPRACPRSRRNRSLRSLPMASVAADYLPILLFLGVALGLSLAFVVLPMIVAKLTGAARPYPDKLTEYECGFPAFEDSRAQVDVRFYLVAILFIVFDIEAAY